MGKMEGAFCYIDKGRERKAPVKRNKVSEKETEDLNLEALPSTSFFEEMQNPMPPIQPASYREEEIENPPMEDFGLEVTEELAEEREELEVDQKLLEKEALFHPQDITWEYLKGLEKISLLTPEKEVELAKRIKEGERQLRLLEINTDRLRNELDPPSKSIKKKKPRVATRGNRKLIKGKNGNNGKKSKHDSRGIEKFLLYKRAQVQHQHAINETRRAKNELIQANLRLVVSIAKRYANRGLSFLDLIQEGNLGLMQALVKFDYTKGYKFSTYASWWIRAAILRAFAEKSRTIRIPNYLFEIKGKLMKSFKSLMKKLGREPTSQELSRDSGIALHDVEKILNLTEEPISLDTPIGEEDSTLKDLIADEKSLSPNDCLLEKDLTRHIRKLLGGLSAREEKILRLRFGIGEDGECTLEEIGRQFNLSRERIRQIEAKALERLRDPNRHKEIREYFE